jgi:hypothetical protein
MACALLAFVGLACAAAEEKPTDAHAHVSGGDAHEIEVWYSSFYAGGPEYPRLTREHHQESLFDALCAANAEIPSAIVSAAMGMWKLKPEGGGLLAPTVEKVDGKSLPLSIRLTAPSR